MNKINHGDVNDSEWNLAKTWPGYDWKNSSANYRCQKTVSLNQGNNKKSLKKIIASMKLINRSPVRT